MAHKYVNNS